MSARPKPQGGDYRPHYRKDETDTYIAVLERKGRLAAEALEKIITLDFARNPDGSRNLYNGPACFVRAWLIAYDAMETIKREQTS